MAWRDGNRGYVGWKPTLESQASYIKPNVCLYTGKQERLILAQLNLEAEDQGPADLAEKEQREVLLSSPTPSSSPRSFWATKKAEAS